MSTIPEAAVEAAALAAFKASPDWTPHCGDTIPNSWHQDEYRREAKAALEAALPHIREHIAAEISDYWDACGDLIDSHNTARLAFDAVIDQIRTGSGE